MRRDDGGCIHQSHASCSLGPRSWRWLIQQFKFPASFCSTEANFCVILQENPWINSIVGKIGCTKMGCTKNHDRLVLWRPQQTFRKISGVYYHSKTIWLTGRNTAWSTPPPSNLTRLASHTHSQSQRYTMPTGPATAIGSPASRALLAIEQSRDTDCRKSQKIVFRTQWTLNIEAYDKEYRTSVREDWLLSARSITAVTWQFDHGVTLRASE